MTLKSASRQYRPRTECQDPLLRQRIPPETWGYLTTISKRKETTMETLNYLACASAGLGRKRMESMKRRTSLAWLIFALLTGLLSLGIAGPEISSRRREKRPWRSSRSQGSTIGYAQALAAARYGVYPKQPQLATWYADHPRQQIRARFTPDGLQVQVKPGHGDLRCIGMKNNGFTQGDIRLHAVTAGPQDGPVVIRLHGFPEFWNGRHKQTGPLASAGFRVIAPRPTRL